MLNKKRMRAGILLCFWSSKKAFSFLIVIWCSLIGLSCMDFIILRYVAPVTSLLRVLLYHKRKLNFVKCFFLSVELHLLLWSTWICVYLNMLAPWNNPHLVMVNDSFSVFLDSVWYYFVEDFASVFIRDIGW